MSFREKTAWISLVSTGAIYGYYFTKIGGDIGRTGTFGFVPFLVGTVVVLVIVQVVLAIALAISSPKDAKAPRDEREQLIAVKARAIGFHVISAGTFVVCLLAAVRPSPFAVINALLFVLVVAELVCAASQVVQFRRSA